MGPNSFSCGICKADCKNEKRCRDHLESSQHQANLKRIADLWTSSYNRDEEIERSENGLFNCPLCLVNWLDLLSYGQHCAGIHRIRVHMISESSDQYDYNCHLCQTWNRTLKQIQNHLKGSKHQRNLISFQSDWSELSRERRNVLLESGVLDCQLCDVQSSGIQSYINHSNGRKHLGNLEDKDRICTAEIPLSKVSRPSF